MRKGSLGLCEENGEWKKEDLAYFPDCESVRWLFPSLPSAAPNSLGGTACCTYWFVAAVLNKLVNKLIS